ncbi:hypothetical protein Droror1_Dr00012724 [Drosera rotundifolia]
MEVKELLHMKPGDGQLSYAQNQATFTQKVAFRTKPMLEAAIRLLLSDHNRNTIIGHSSLSVADLGCGPAPTSFVSTMVEAVKRICGEAKEELHEIQVYMNDLASNDFNSLFRELAGFQQRRGDGGGVDLFLMGVPGSFHDRLFPAGSLHLVHSSYSLHWLSQVPQGLFTEEGTPINKGNIYISKTSPPAVAKAYLARYEEDLSSFLCCRSIEVVPYGCMVLAVRGRPQVDHLTWEPWELRLLNLAFSNLISQRIVKEEKVDSLNIPFYGASEEEISNIVEREGSFRMEHMETVVQHVADEIEDSWSRAGKLANIIRSYTESVIVYHFGRQIVEPLYDELTRVTFEFLAVGSPEHLTISLLLRRKSG